MDNNSSFEQQFAQSLNVAPQQPASGGTGSSKLPIIISIVLAVIVVVESIALVFTMNNYLSVADTSSETTDEEEVVDEEEDEPVDNNYVYDDSDALIAMNANCRASDGSTIVLDTSNNYTATGAFTGSGTYTIVNESLVSLSGADKVLYYDGWDLADGLTIYTCGEDTTNTEE